MTQVANRDHSLALGLLHRRAHASKRAAAAAVTGILQLDGDAIGIAEIELRRSLRRATQLRPAHPDANLHGPAAKTPSRRLCPAEAVIGERLHEAIDVEVLDTQTEMVDAWRAAALTERQRM